MSTRVVHMEPVAVRLGTMVLDADLTLPETCTGLVVFAHGSGSSRFSPRNRAVAVTLNEAHLGTMLMDLLTLPEQESDEYTARLRFDIDLLADRLIATVDWTRQQANLRQLPLGLFGASTGAAAALVAAAKRPDIVRSVVSRGGRPDLAMEQLGQVKAPVLLIVGGHDPQVIEVNDQAARRLAGRYQLDIIPGATHLFEEPGTLDQVAQLAAEWFRETLPPQAQ